MLCWKIDVRYSDASYCCKIASPDDFHWKRHWYVQLNFFWNSVFNLFHISFGNVIRNLIGYSGWKKKKKSRHYLCCGILIWCYISTSYLQDLEFLSSGLEGRSSNPVALLFDNLTHPDADIGMENASILEWRHHTEKSLDHVVLGKMPVGGAWQVKFTSLIKPMTISLRIF